MIKVDSMSNVAFGVIILSSNLSYYQLSDLSFDISATATSKKIGLLLGANVTYQFSVQIDSPNVKYEFIDNPFTSNCEIMFAGDGIKIYENKTRTDIGESLYSRMKRLQDFFDNILSTNCVQAIEFYLLECDSTDKSDVDFCFEVEVKNLCSTICSIYANDHQRTPDMKILLHKNL
jgi:hypothetical protein